MPFMALEEWLEGATYPFTIKTCSTSKQPNASTHLKPSGPCSSPGLSSPSPTSWIPKTDWVHTTLATGHPQTLRTIHHLLWAKFWWPHVTQLTLLSVLLSTCAQAKVPHTLPVRKLVPLPTPQWPWSHWLYHWPPRILQQYHILILQITTSHSPAWVTHSLHHGRAHVLPFVYYIIF